MEPDQPQSCWTLSVTVAAPRGARRQVFSKNIGDCYHNAVWWMHRNIPEIEAVLEKHVNNEPQVRLSDTWVSEDN